MIKEAISQVISGRSLTMDEAAQVMTEIMDGQVTPAQFGAFVTALRCKGETVEEIAGMARTMRAKAIRVEIDEPLVDTCGTGGDNSATFNISTGAAFVAAGAGLKIAKHGNRAMSSKSGSADVLEALGVKIDLTAEQVRRCLKEVGIGFMFAPSFHPAMKYAAGPRREIGIRTVFNILGPLTNPAGAQAQVLGVADAALVEKMARVLQLLGCRHALVVHGQDGLDELTVTGTTFIAELKSGELYGYSITPESLELPRAKPEDLKGGTAQENAAILSSVLSGTRGHARNAVALNAAAALVAGDAAGTLQDGLRLANESIDSGRAMKTLEGLIALSNKLS
ncbi:MAG: anthranilate phosphoribosyltransferase [Dehalococcoidia bacterium]|nr:anthranilate phosphoribosyltransferase [Dehalococcoidia bacterium]